MKCEKHKHELDTECPSCAAIKRMRKSVDSMVTGGFPPGVPSAPTAATSTLDPNMVQQINNAFRLYDHRMKKLEEPEPLNQKQALIRMTKAAMIAALSEAIDIYFPTKGL